MSSPLSSAGSSLSQSTPDVERPTKRQRTDEVPAPLLSAAIFSFREIKELQPRARPIEENSQTNLNTSLDEYFNVFLQQVKTCSEKLTGSLNYLISKAAYHPIDKMPWEELNDEQKNYFFSCLFEILILSPNDVIQVILEKNRKCLPLTTTPDLYNLFLEYFTRLTEPVVLVLPEHLSQGVICSRKIGQIFKSHEDMTLQDAIVTVNIPHHLFLQDAFSNFIKALSNDIPAQTSLLDVYLIYLFARYFEGSSKNLVSSLKERCEDRFQQKGLPREFPQLTAGIGYRALQSKTFDFFYKISGPLLYNVNDKAAILNAFPELMERYIFITFDSTSFSFLISKAHLEEIPYFKAITKNAWKEGTKSDELCIASEESSLDHWMFFSFFFKKEKKNLTLLPCLPILRLSNYYLCDKADIEDLIIRLITKPSGVLHLEDDMVLPVVSHMLYSSRLKELLERTIWKLLSSSNNFDKQLLQLKPVLHLFDSINLYTIDNNQFLKVVQHFSDNLETLNLDAKNVVESSFKKILEFKKLKKLKLFNFTDFPRSALQVLQGMTSLQVVELTDKSQRFATLGFTQALPWESLSLTSKKYNTTLMKAVPKLNHLTIELSKEQIPAFISDLKNLKKLLSLHIYSSEDLDGSQLFEKVLQLPYLQSLTFDKNREAQSISCHALNLTSANVSMKELYLRFPVQPEILKCLPNLKSLHLVVSQTQLSPLLAALEQLPSLESLSIHLTDPPPAMEISPEGYQQYQLYDLDEPPFAYPEFPDFDFSVLRKLRSFTFTSYPVGSQFSENTYKALAKIESLERVFLPEMSFSNDMMHLIKKDHLKSLELEKTDNANINQLLAYAKERNIKITLV